MGETGNNNGKRGKGQQNNRNGMFFCLIVALIVVMSFFYMMNKIEEGTNKKITYNEFITMLEGGTVSEIQVDSDGGRILIIPKQESESQTVPAFTITYYTGILEDGNKIQERCAAAGVAYSRVTVDKTNSILSSILSTVLMFVVIYGVMFFVFRMFSKSGGGMMGVGKSNAKVYVEKETGVTFKDVAGQEEAKESLTEMVDFLHNPGKYTRIGAKLPKGALLVGPPGTGKTLLAKAVAGEAGVPFFSISGSDFVEMYVGVGASRVRDLFESARKYPASIIFIDEIDAVGRHRGAGLGGGHDEREQTLNQLLVEMDGFGTHEGVIVIAATNRPDILDPALLRPGRFDRQVTVNYPDLKGRVEILRVHVRNKPLEENVDLEKVAQTTVGFTGADLANLLNEAALLAAKRGKHLIGMDEINEATLKILVGTDKKKKIRSEEDTKITAYHEAGHAILSHLLPGQDPVTRISIIPTSKGAGGYTLTPPEKDKSYEYKKQMQASIAVCMGGRVAEQLVFDDYTGGASQDIKQATSIARTMVTVYGMSDKLGAVCLAGQHGADEVFLGRDFSASRDYSETTAAQIDAEIRNFVDEGYQTARKLLGQYIEKLHFIAQYLIRHEVMDGAQFKAAMDENATEEDLIALAEERDRKSREENARAAEKATERARETATERDRRFEEERNRLAREALGLEAEDAAIDDVENAAGSGENELPQNAEQDEHKDDTTGES